MSDSRVVWSSSAPEAYAPCDRTCVVADDKCIYCRVGRIVLPGGICNLCDYGTHKCQCAHIVTDMSDFHPNWVSKCGLCEMVILRGMTHVSYPYDFYTDGYDVCLKCYFEA